MRPSAPSLALIVVIGMSVPTVMGELMSIGPATLRDKAVGGAPNRVGKDANVGRVGHACLSECNPDVFIAGSKHLCSPHTGVSGICESHPFYIPLFLFHALRTILL